MIYNKNKLARSVSIIGIGSTPYGKGERHPEIQKLTEHELFSWAALNAMEDAGISPGQVELLIHGQVCNVSYSRLLNPAATYQDWCGMHGRPGIHQEAGCATAYISFNQAVMAVASGAYNFALAGGVEILSTRATTRKPSCYREVPPKEFPILEIPNILSDPTYSRFPSNFAHDSLFSYPAVDYMEKYGVSKEQFDDMNNALAISCRRGAARHPLATYQTEFEDLAKEAGYGSAMEYLRAEEVNPWRDVYARKFHSFANTDGASAVIVCPTELARQFKQQPIEVLSISGAAMDTRHPRNEHHMTASVYQQAYEGAGVKPGEIDLFMTQDLRIYDQIDTAEMAGYLPEGEGWKYAIEGRTAFDGDRPINTNGGRTAFGHSYGASGLADIGEIVQQMRGQAGARQMKKRPETALIRGVGGGQNATAAILRAIQ